MLKWTSVRNVLKRSTEDCIEYFRLIFNVGFFPDGWGRILLRQIAALNAHACLTWQFANSGVTKFTSCTRNHLKLSTIVTYQQPPPCEPQMHLHGLWGWRFVSQQTWCAWGVGQRLPWDIRRQRAWGAWAGCAGGLSVPGHPAPCSGLCNTWCTPEPQIKCPLLRA